MDKTKESKNILKFFIGIFLLIISSFTVTLIIKYTNNYPRGNDVYGHLFKIKILYNEICKGNLYPTFTKNWYNGIELFRYWTPASYYFYCIFMFITNGNIYTSFLMFLFSVFFIGGFGWLLFGLRENRMWLCIFISIIFFLLPDNLRVFFAEGNIPRIFITMILPYIFFFIHEFLVYKKRYALIILVPFIVLLVFSHIMISAMFGISIFIFLIFYSIFNKCFIDSFVLLCDIICGYIIAGIFLIPGLIGGIVTQNSTASQATSAAMWSQNLFKSLNPIARLSNIDQFYFGISIFIILLLGILAFRKQVVSGFLTCLILFLGTAMIAVPILSVMPLTQVFWMIRFIPIAEIMFLISLIYWKQLKKITVFVFCGILFIDSLVSFYCVSRPQVSIEQAQKEISENYLLDEASEITDSRLALLDLSSIGSYPAFYVIQDKDINYLYGWAYQGAKTIKEIVSLNEAFENGYYVYVFDRLIEYGCDTVIIKKDIIKDKTAVPLILETAQKLGYTLIKENDYAYLFDYEDITGDYGLIPQYENVCIGNAAEYISYLYPSFYKLSDDYLDDYTFDDLKNYKKIFLSGPSYRDKEYCEKLVLDLAKSGVKFYIDMNNLQDEKSIGRNSFLGVTAQPVTFTETFPILEMKNGSQFKLGVLNEDYTEWCTIYLSNMQNKTRRSEYKKGKYLDYLGTSANENITFIGLNLVYYCAASHTQAEQLYKFLDEIFEESREYVPPKKIVPLTITYGRNSINIHSNFDNVNTSIANLDGFLSDKISKTSTFILINSGDTIIDITYTYLNEGLLCTLIGLVLCTILWIIVFNSSRYKKKLST